MRRGLQRLLAGAALATACVAGLGVHAPAPASASDNYDPIGWMPDNEGSGLVASRAYPGVFWAQRDSGPGDRTALYAFKVQNGHLVDLVPGVKWRRIEVLGASNVDWEDLALDPATNTIWIGDIGNNSCRRDNLALLKVAEPNPYTATAAPVKAAYPFVWGDYNSGCTGRNAESLLFVDGAPWIVSKQGRTAMYRFATLNAGQKNRLERVVEITQPAGGFDYEPTAADVSADGSRLVIATASRNLWVYTASDSALRGEARVRDLVSRPPRWNQQYDRNYGDVQVEGAAFVRDGNDLVLLSEGTPVKYFPTWFYQS